MEIHDKYFKIIYRTLYSNVSYPVSGNREILASNLLFAEIGISDLDSIYELAKYIEKIHKDYLELDSIAIDKIMEKYRELIKKYRIKRSLEIIKE